MGIFNALNFQPRNKRKTRKGNEVINRKERRDHKEGKEFLATDFTDEGREGWGLVDWNIRVSLLATKYDGAQRRARPTGLGFSLVTFISLYKCDSYPIVLVTNSCVFPHYLKCL
jgi:hypothetical protein